MAVATANKLVNVSQNTTGVVSANNKVAEVASVATGAIEDIYTDLKYYEYLGEYEINISDWNPWTYKNANGHIYDNSKLTHGFTNLYAIENVDGLTHDDYVVVIFQNINHLYYVDNAAFFSLVDVIEFTPGKATVILHAKNIPEGNFKVYLYKLRIV